MLQENDERKPNGGAGIRAQKASKRKEIKEKRFAGPFAITKREKFQTKKVSEKAEEESKQALKR